MKANNKIDALVPWGPDFFTGAAIFEPLAHLLRAFDRFEQWPALEDYQQFLDQWPTPIHLLSGKKLIVVPQDEKASQFEEHYAPRIYNTGEVQTRTGNWHDFFQFLTWFVFPRTKAVINSIHVPSAMARYNSGSDPGRRSPVENMLSLFDEGGVVILSTDPSLLQLIRDFRWMELFWHRRSVLEANLQCITFGHALYEKALSPYLGMTGNAILFEVDREIMELPMAERLDRVDTLLAGIFTSGEQYQKPRDLSPFPVLGMPGWDMANSRESYYRNTDYFRPGRGVRQVS